MAGSSPAMSASAQSITVPTLRRSPKGGLRRWTEREAVFSWLMIIPPALFLVLLVGYPLVYGIWLSLESRPVAKAGTFVGLANFIADWHDPVFWQVTRNTFVYTFAATILKMAGGLGLALVMNQEFKFKNTIRALMLLPFIVPTVLSTIAWMWILDPAFSVINWFLRYFDLANPGPSWLGNPSLAMFSLIIVNTWRGLPFYAITLLAGLQTISPELYEAATIDGASALARFRYVTLPLLKPVIFIVTMFSVIFTFADFQLVYVLTRGGPANATHLFATYAFDVAMGGGQLGMGASIALSMLPPLALIIIAMSLYMKPNKS
jgi:multiple sugar transport system permease protein